MRIAYSPHLAGRTHGFPLANESSTSPKGAGLLRLPAEWYPPSVFLEGIASPAGFSDEELGISVGALMQGHQGEIIVRSNMPDESIRDRGRYSSMKAASTSTQVGEAVGVVVEQALEEGLQTAGVILQPLLPVELHGFAANAHRTSREATSWAVEVWRGGSERGYSWQVGQLPFEEDIEFDARTPEEALSVLRRACRTLSRRPHRLNLEWIWDGSRVWIVQADVVPPTFGPAPGDQFHPTMGGRVNESSLRAWTPATRADDSQRARWGKLRAINQFASIGAPTARLWFTTGKLLLESAEAVKSDLEKIASGHVVVRVDVAADQQVTMLDRSGALTTADDVQEWCESQLNGLAEQGVEPSDVAFFAHRYVRARAAAWARARPNGASVRIDALWGTPGGLDWLPHDSATVSALDGRIRRSTRGKTHCEDLDETGGWCYRELPSEWIWRGAATDDQLRTIATFTQGLANNTDEPVVAMWFVGLLDESSHDCLPWMYLPEAPFVSDGIGTSVTPRARSRLAIESDDDLRRESWPRESVLHVSPKPEVFRSKSFVERLAEISKSHEIPVEIQGSALGHVYYELRRLGAIVVGAGDGGGRPQVTAHGKLVRDEIPTRIASRGEYAARVTAGPRELEGLLRQKLVEEALEVNDARTEDALLEEIADAWEVLESLRRVVGISRNQVRSRVNEKRARAGGFNEGVFLVSSSSGPYVPASQPQETLPGLEDVRPALKSDPVSSSQGVLRVSLVPPRQREERTWRARIGGVDVSISYERDSVVLRSAMAIQDQLFSPEDPDAHPDPR